MITIALLKSRRAIYIKRETEVVKCNVPVSFHFQDGKGEDVPDGLTAIFFKENGQNFYRPIVNGLCEIDSKHLLGLTQIRVADISNWQANEVWDSESLVGKAVDENYMTVQAADVDLAKEHMALTLELDNLRLEVSELKDKITKTNERLTKAFEGWDII